LDVTRSRDDTDCKTQEDHMTRDTILANATLVLPNETLRGQVRLVDGRIADIAEGPAVPTGAEDCGGDLVMPGLIELHTDNLERHIEPRPKVDWPHAAAIIAHDAELASVGITTVFDALRVGSVVSDAKTNYGEYARVLADEILALRGEGALKISHFLHLRAEVCSETLVEELDKFGPEDRIGIVSLMDHTPGERQFRDLTQLRKYVMGKRGMSDTEFEAHVAAQKALKARNGPVHEAAAVAAARRYGQPRRPFGRARRTLCRVSDDGRGRPSLHRARDQGHDGRTEPDPRRQPFRQRRCPRPGRSEPAAHCVV
jgi:alpha-D-ribose 1-methylphosphonate 5-triphosphate diphosphatase